MCTTCNELYDSGYLDKKDYALIGNVITKLRFSEYLPFDKVSEHIFRLREFYNVGYYEATYYYQDKVMFFNYYNDRRIVRIFPLEDYKKMDKLEQLKLGVIYVNEGDKSILENEEDIFEYLPPVVNSTEYELDEETRKKREQIEKEWNEIKSKIDGDSIKGFSLPLVVAPYKIQIVYIDDKFKHKMREVFKEQILDLEEVVPNFRIANATIHFDESSPHLHIVGVPFKDGMKNGMEKQVGKSDVFNKISLVNIQDKMREYCINSFNRIYHLNYTLKEKEEGRNVDINVANMNEYKKFKREQEKYKKQLKELNNKADELQNKSNEMNNIIDNLKPTITNKNNFTISNENVEKIKKYIEQTNDTTSNLRDSNDINIVLQKYEDDLREHSNEVRNLKKKIKTRDDRIEELEYGLNVANDTIY